MISLDQAKVIGAVLKKFNENEPIEWCEVDEHMQALSWLNDEQVYIEAQNLLATHAYNNARCNTDHPQEQCFVPVVLAAIGYILEDYKTSQRLAKKARYVLEYYMAISYTGSIIHD